MRWTAYMRDRVWFIIVNLLGLICLAVFLKTAGNTWDTIVLLIAIWLMVLIAGLFISYQSRRKYLEGLLVLTENLKERYLLSEVMEKPDRAEDAVFYRILKLSHKSMLEKVAETAQEQKEYKEYIEQWVHEAKAPVTAMKLLCENQNTEDKRALLSELERMNHYIEQTLFSREVSTQRRII